MRTKVPQGTRRLVFNRSIGRCEYLQCTRVSARLSEDGNRVRAIGQFAHILPNGDGPRAEFKPRFDIDLAGSDNIILLCKEHHALVDEQEPQRHPPAALFEMVRRKAEYHQTVIEEVVTARPFGISLEEISSDVRVAKVFDLLNQYTLTGPRRGGARLNDADKLLVNMKANPLIDLPTEYIDLLRLEVLVRRLTNEYNSKFWVDSLGRVKRDLARIESPQRVLAAVVMISVLIRDEFKCIGRTDRLSLVHLLSDKLEVASKKMRDPGFHRSTLICKAGLLRWRARLSTSKVRDGALAEADRCALRAMEGPPLPAAILQRSLVKFTHARMLPLRSRQEYAALMLEAEALICDRALDSYPPAVKYRPRFFRDSHRFELGLDYFWRAVEAGHLDEMYRTGFIAAECAYSRVVFNSTEHLLFVEEAMTFLGTAIAGGYDHGRNLSGWIECHALLDPDWFRAEVLSKFDIGWRIEQSMEFLRDEGRRKFGDTSFSKDILFGVDEMDFWTLLGRICRTALGDVDAALEFYRRAERHSQAPGGNFSTKLGLGRGFCAKKVLGEARRYQKMMESTALAFQGSIVDGFKAEVDGLEAELGAAH